jgi:hypothetical protein
MKYRSECTAPIKWENRGRRPRLSFEGGEEKSPYCLKFIIMASIVLDVGRTIPLRLTDSLQECRGFLLLFLQEQT